MSFDVAILGAGVIGASAAFHLADRGYRVAVIGDGAPGASHAAAGMLSPSFEIGHDAADPAFAALMREGLALWDDFAHRVSSAPGRDFGYARTGAYGIGYHAVPRGAERPRQARPLPAFSRQPTAFAPDEGLVEPAALIDVLLDRAAARGARIIKARGQVVDGRVETAGETIGADTIILACGSGAEGAPPGLQAVRGQAYVVRLAPEDAGAVPTVVRSPTAYFCPRRDGTLYVGATEEWPGAIAGTAEEVWRDAGRLLPALGRATVLTRLAGSRPFLRRGGPVVERDRERGGLVRAQGHHRNGVLLAPWTALRLEAILRAG